MAARTNQASWVDPSVKGHSVEEVPNNNNAHVETGMAAPGLHTYHRYLT